MLNRFTGMVDMSKIAADVQSGLLAWLTSWEKADPVKRQWLCRKLEMRLYSSERAAYVYGTELAR